MIKAIVIIRESTEQQEIDSQRIETIGFAKSFGYTDNEIKVIGKAGASAIKLDDAYMNNLNEVYNTIESNSNIEKVFAWSLDRIGRKAWMMMQLVDFLIAHRVNLLTKNPSLYLLNDDGSENTGMKFAINIYCTMAEEEMKMKFARFKRKKEYMAERGQFCGGQLKYGYTTDENNYIVINEEEAAVVRMIYEMYASGKYSVKTLQKELNSQGYDVSWNFVRKTLIETCYYGINENNSLIKKYPKIIDKEIYDKCQAIKKKNFTMISKESRNKKLALRILKCFICGKSYGYSTTFGGVYECYNHKYYKRDGKEKCDSVTILSKFVDLPLVITAKRERMKYLLNLNETTAKDTEEKIALLNKKIEVANGDLPKIELQKNRVKKLYIKGHITEKECDEDMAEYGAKETNINKSIASYKNEIKLLKKTLDDLKSEDFAVRFSREMSIVENVVNIYDDETIYKMVHDFLKSAYVTKFRINNRDFKILVINTVSGDQTTFIIDFRGVQKDRYKVAELTDDSYQELVDKAQYTDWMQGQMKVNFKDIHKLIKPFQEKVSKL